MANNGFCPDWIADNFDRYVDPFWQHVYLTLISVAIGFVIAFALALLAHRKRWLIRPDRRRHRRRSTPSRASPLFLLLLPHHRPRQHHRARRARLLHAADHLRNVTTGLDNVPDESVDAARGMGLTERQLLWRVELPLALPEILAGLRIAITTTVGLATLAFFAGAGGLGEEIYAATRGFKSNVVVAGGAASCWPRCST